jgi:spermidine/putrescine transport system permease protein
VSRAGTAWALAAPALLVLLVGAAGPLLVVVAFSVLSQGEFGGVALPLSGQGWFRILFERDIFDDTLSVNSAHLVIFWRSLWIAAATTVLALLLGLPTAWFIATRPERSRALWLFLVTIPFWTNLLIRTFAIMEVIRNEGLLNTALLGLGLIDQPVQILFTDWATLIGSTYVYLPLMVLPLFARWTAWTGGSWRRATTFTLAVGRFCAAWCFRRSGRGSWRAASWCSSRPSAPMSRRACWAAAPT